MKLAKKRHILPVILSGLLLLGGCAALSLKAPSVTLADIKVLEAGLFEQRFGFKLRVQNPNDKEIAISGMSFMVEINGKPFARGVSNQGVTVPRLEERILEVTAVSNLYSILSQIHELLYGNSKGFSYRIKGRLFTEAYGELEFDESGSLAPPPPGAKKEEITALTPHYPAA